MEYDWHKERREKLEWIQNLKVGDEVVIVGYGYTHANYSMANVTRITKAQIIVSKNGYEQKFWKKDGEEVGGELYRKPSISPLTEKIKADMENQRIATRFSNALYWLQQQRNHLSLEDKQNIGDFITEFSKRIEEKEQKRLDTLAELQKESQEMGLYDGDKPNA